jgi:exopolysaccharide production protein ExoQ
MSTDAITIAAPARRWIDEIVFLAFLAIVFIGHSPFHAPDPATVQLGGAVSSGGGDTMRQIAYLTAFAGFVIVALRRHGPKAFSALPLVLLGLLTWCVASALWSPEPGVTVRRAGLAVVLVGSAMLSVETLGTEKAMRLWRWVLLGLLVVNIVSVKFVADAVHLPGEADPALVGNWRGLYVHKNIAGAVGAITALVFLFTPRAKIWHKLADLGVVALALFFTVMTHSKSSLGLLVVAIAAGAVYRIAWRRDIDRTIALVAMGLVLIAGIVLSLADQGVIARLISDPQQFTGRTQIWNAEIAYIRDHPLFGAGFGTFADTGGVSPLAHYVGGWVSSDAANGHNGFLQLLVTVGGVGFVLAMVALIVLPLADFWRRGQVPEKSVLFALFVFLVLHNLMETDFLESDGVAWVANLLVLAMLGRLRRGPA